MWRTRKLLSGMAVCLASAGGHAATTGCDPEVLRAFQETERVVDSLRPEKPGQMRVFAPDGREFTAGQTLWMQRQMKRVNEACAHGDEKDAARLLESVRELLDAHTKAS